MELTKEHFDEHITKFNTRLNKVVTKEDLTTELSGVKKDILGLKTDVSGLKTSQSSLLSELSDLKTGQDSLSGQFKSMHLDLTEVKETVAKIDKRDLEDSNLFNSVVVGHDRRLRRIEKHLNMSKLKTA